MTKDRTRYRFEGTTFGKARLVHALVSAHLRRHPSTVFADLLAAFPDRLQSDSPLQFDRLRCVVKPLDLVPPASMRHFFDKPGERVQLADGPVLVSREWNLHNIRNVIEHARQLGFYIEVVGDC